MFKFLCLALFAFNSVLAIKYTDCGSSTGTVSSVVISGCENQDVCELHKGTKAKITITFTPKSDSSSLKAVVHGVIHQVPMPFVLPKPDACQNCGVSCPVKKGTSYTYNKELDVKSIYPSLDVTIRWELKDQSSTDMVCVEIPAKIV